MDSPSTKIPDVNAILSMAPPEGLKSPFVFPQQRTRRVSLPATPPEVPSDFHFFPQTPTAKPQRQEHMQDSFPMSPPITPVRSGPITPASSAHVFSTPVITNNVKDHPKFPHRKHATRASIALPSFYMPRRGRRNSNARNRPPSNKALQRLIDHFTPLTPFKIITLFALTFTALYIAARVRNLLLPRHHKPRTNYSGLAGQKWDTAAASAYNDKPAWVGGAGRPMAVPDKRMIASAAALDRDIIREHPEAFEKSETPARRHAAAVEKAKAEALARDVAAAEGAGVVGGDVVEKTMERQAAEEAKRRLEVEDEVRARKPPVVHHQADSAAERERMMEHAKAAHVAPPVHFNRNAMKVRPQVAVPMDSSSYPPDSDHNHEHVVGVHPPHAGSGSSGEGVDPRAAKRKVMSPRGAAAAGQVQEEASEQTTWAEGEAVAQKNSPEPDPEDKTKVEAAVPGKKAKSFGNRGQGGVHAKGPKLKKQRADSDEMPSRIEVNELDES